MNLAYVEENAEYVATMEEAITRLTAAGHFLTTQALYAFVGQEVAGSYAQVAAFLKERGDALQVDAFWDLRGRIGQWITQHGLEDESYKVALYLARLTAEVRLAHDVHVLARLQALEAASADAPSL